MKHPWHVPAPSGRRFASVIIPVPIFRQSCPIREEPAQPSAVEAQEVAWLSIVRASLRRLRSGRTAINAADAQLTGEVLMIYFAVPFALFLAVTGTGTLRAGLQVWRNQTPPGWVARQNPLFSEAVWHGVRRALVPMSAFQWFLSGLVLAVGAVINSDPTGTPTPGPMWANLLLWLAVLGLLTSGWLAFSVVAFNQPQFLVPRHLRDQLGSWTAYRQGV